MKKKKVVLRINERNVSIYSIIIWVKYAGLDFMGTNLRQNEIIWGWAELMYVQSPEVLHFACLLEPP